MGRGFLERHSIPEINTAFGKKNRATWKKKIHRGDTIKLGLRFIHVDFLSLGPVHLEASRDLYASE